ncbi:GldG family protein [Elioraea thermophila]|uniref:GldG family protein n=1 Tax=Elioraea thermophila TaxID=2185104 RepID=UPI000DF2828C|nr:Gldg family protein [Elioraea thermophila]
MEGSAAILTRSSPPAEPAPGRRPRRRLLSAAGLAAALVLVVGINILSETFLGRYRLDLTENRLYTLSEGTKTVLRQIPEPITLRLFYSPRLGRDIPLYASYHTRVRELLAEYAALAGGKLRLEFYEPEPFSDLEDRAIGYGLQGVPVDQSGEQVFFGLAASNLLDEERVIPFFQPERERFLEFDLTRLIYELSNPKKPVVGLMTGLPVNGEMRGPFGRPTPPWTVVTQMRQFLSVREVPLDAAEIPADIDVLMLAHPQNLAERTQYALDQFVLRGGRLLLLLDPHSEAQASRPGPGGVPPRDTASDLPRLLAAWGIAFDRDKVVGDLRGAMRVRAGERDRVQAVDYVAWFTASGPGQINRADPATGELNQIAFASAGFLTPREGAPGSFEPLITTSPEAGVIDAARVRVEPDPTRILAEFRPEGTPRVLAARVRGTFETAFPDGPPKAEGEAEPARSAPHLARSNGTSTVVVIADSDVLEDRFWVRVQDFFGQQVATPVADNGALIVNLLDTLSGSEALIGLRSRGESRRPFELVDRMRREAEREYRAREQALLKRLEELEKTIRDIRRGAGEGARAEAILTADQREAIERARADILATRRELRDVQRDLRRDIENLQTTLRLANIVAVPAVVSLVAIGLGVWRIRRRARRAEEPRQAHA